jgi:hypothetical protein
MWGGKVGGKKEKGKRFLFPFAEGLKTYFLPPFLAPAAGFSAVLVEAVDAFGLVSAFFFIVLLPLAKRNHYPQICNLGVAMPLHKRIFSVIVIEKIDC